MAGERAEELWRQLSGLELFRTFTAEQRQAFHKGLDSEPGMRIQRFGPRALICKKGEYELDLCFVLRGEVEFFDDVAGKGRIRTGSLGTGNFYGELGAIGGLPRTTDVVAATDSEIFYMPRHTLKYIEINAEARKILSDRYRERAVRIMAGKLELFKGVPSSFVDQLVPRSEILRYDLRGVSLITQGEKGDAMYIVRDGFVQVVREREDGSKRVMAYLRTGEFFGEMALISDEPRYANVLTAGKCELIKLLREDVLELCSRFPEAKQHILEVVRRRHEQEQRITPEISEILERSGQLGVIQADALLVMDMDLCVKCDSCVKACESLHGKSRLVRTGIQIGKYLVPSACRHCDDPKCMNSCPTGAIKRRPEGEIYFQYDMCIGCGNCAIACPYDNIAMIDTPTFDEAQARKSRTMGDPNFYRPLPVASHDRMEPGLWRRLFSGGQASAPPPAAKSEHPHIPPAFPIKCDLCDGLPFMGCVHNCPTGAAIRIDPATLFKETGAVSAGSRVRKAGGGND